MTLFCLEIQFYNRGVLACTDFARTYISSRASVILIRCDTFNMRSALCGPLPLLQYFTGWRVMGEVVTAFLFSVEGDMCLFLGAWLSTFPIVAMGFAALIQINLTVTALAITCRFQVNFFPSTSACLRSGTKQQFFLLKVLACKQV